MPLDPMSLIGGLELISRSHWPAFVTWSPAGKAALTSGGHKKGWLDYQGLIEVYGKLQIGVLLEGNHPEMRVGIGLDIAEKYRFFEMV